jgi:predicted membrane-bound spermidine synthase
MSPKLRSLTLVFLTGYIGLAFELLVLRGVANFVGSTAAISSIVIGIYLAAMTAGYFVGTKKMTRDIYETAAAAFLSIAALVILAGSYPLLSFYFYKMAEMGITSPLSQTFAYSAVFLSVAPFLLGFNTAALSQTMHDAEKSNTGVIMGTGTIGSVLGSMVTTLVFMAMFGLNVAVAVTAALSAAAACAACRRKKIFTAALMVTAMAWVVNDGARLYKKYGIVSNNDVNTVAVLEGWNGSRYLLVDSAVHSVVSQDGKRYAEYINFIDDNLIKTMPKNGVKNILVLGAGGFTVGHLDGYNAYTFVDIDGALPKIAEKYFLKKKLGPNKNFVLSDAGQFLKAAESEYDLIVMDIFSRWTIPESAITTDFMAAMKSRLKKGGVIVINTIGSASFGDKFSRKLDNTIRYAFPHNLSRHIIGAYDAWGKTDEANVLYIYHDAPNDGALYTPNNNSTVYDK